MKKVLMLTGVYWDETLQRHQQFAEYLVKNGFQVYFIEHIVSSKFNLKAVLQRFFKGRKNDKFNANPKSKGIHLYSPNFLFPGSGCFDIYNKYRVSELIEKTGSEFDLVINYLPISTTRYIIEAINYKKLIYDCVRNFKAWGGYYSSIEKEEEWLINNSDTIFTDSAFLTDAMKQRTSKKVVQFMPIANNLWLSGCVERKIHSISKIAYFGSYGSHIDTETLRHLVEHKIELHVWGELVEQPSFPFIYHGFCTDLSLLANEITTTVDAIIIPYKGNMDGVIPAKLIQCMTSGLPVVVSSFYDTNVLSDLLYVYRTQEEALMYISKFQNSEFSIKLEKIKKFTRDLTEGQQLQDFSKKMNDLCLTQEE